MLRSPQTTNKEIRAPLEYRIKVLGHLDQEWSENLSGLQISNENEEGKDTVTTLSGPLLDQSALLGVLNFLYNHRFWLLSVDCISYSGEHSGLPSNQQHS